MNLTQKRILADAEARMTSTTGPAMSDEAAARWQRAGLSLIRYPHLSTEGATEVRKLSKIMAGEYPPEMTDADIAWFKQVDAMLEAEC